MNENDVQRQGLEDGDLVRVTSARGELETVIRSSREVAEGELFMPWHFSEAQVNRLTRGGTRSRLENSPVQIHRLPC